MGSPEIKQAVDAANDFLSRNPGSARYTDSLATARLSDPGNALTVDVVGPDGASLRTDMPASVGGGGTGPSAGWYLRAAEASCVATLIGMRAAQLGIRLAGVEVTVDSESDDRGILGIKDENGRPVDAGPLSTRVHVTLEAAPGQPIDQMSGDARSALEELAAWAIDHCPVVDAVRRAVPISVEIEVSG